MGKERQMKTGDQIVLFVVLTLFIAALYLHGGKR